MLRPHFLGGEAGHRGLLGGGANRGRRVALVAWAATFVVLTLVLQAVGLAISAVLLVLVLLGTINRGRSTLWESARDARAWKKRQKRGLTRFRPISRRPPVELLTAVERAAYRDWPEGVEGMYWLESDRGEPGIAWHMPPDAAPYLSVVWRVGGSIAGLESDDRVNSSSAAFGSLLAETARALSLVDGIQMVTKAAKLDVTPHELWVLENAAKDAPAELFESYGQLVGSLERSGMTQEHYVVVRWALNARFTERAALRGPAQSGWLAIMHDEIRRMTRKLQRSSLGTVEVLTARQVLAVIRHLQMPSWPSGDMTGIGDPDEIGLAYDEDPRTHVVTNDVNKFGAPEQWLHRTAEVPVRRLEAAMLDALWLVPILSGLPEQVDRTVSTHITTRPAGEARRAARSDLTSDIAEMREQRRKGLLLNESLGAEHEAAQRRHNDLKPGTGVQGAGWAMHITISARTLDDLRLARDVIEAGCSDAGITGLDWLDNHHGAAQSWTWPVGRGMAPFTASASDRVLAVVGGQEQEDSL